MQPPIEELNAYFVATSAFIWNKKGPNNASAYFAYY